RLVVLAIAAGGFLDGALDVVAWHRLRTGRGHREAQPRIERRVGRTELGRDRDFTGKLGEDFAARRIALALAMHDVLGMRMAGHWTSIPRKSWKLEALYRGAAGPCEAPRVQTGIGSLLVSLGELSTISVSVRCSPLTCLSTLPRNAS